MSSRDRMLEKIRSALGEPPQSDLPNFDPALESIKPNQFAEALSALGGVVFEGADFAAAKAKVQEIIAGRSYAASPQAESWGFTSGISPVEADFGISSADFLLADTGSVLFLSASQESRLISLLPPRHIVVIGRQKILSGLDELFARIPLPAAESSSMVIITGPSRTADIEMRLVRGVHGPGEITVIVVNNM